VRPGGAFRGFHRAYRFRALLEPLGGTQEGFRGTQEGFRGTQEGFRGTQEGHNRGFSRGHHFSTL
jgi:hypothetical protein